MDLTPSTVLHTSGVHSAQALAPWRERGVAVAAWHPLVAVAAPSRGAFRGVWFGVDGDEVAIAGRRRARGTSGRTDACRQAGGGGRTIGGAVHAAGVFASNYLVACLRIAVDALRRASRGRGAGGPPAPCRVCAAKPGRAGPARRHDRSRGPRRRDARWPRIWRFSTRSERPCIVGSGWSSSS